jgi:hypothetical protein
LSRTTEDDVNQTLQHLLAVAVIAGAGAALTGCVVSDAPPAVMVAGVPAYAVTDVPVEIESYPHVYYDGGFAYYVEGRWFYRTRGGYVVLQREPAELARFRAGAPRMTARVHVR